MFGFSCTFSCIFENILPAGNDMAALLPRYINIKRGFLICTVLSIACVPWKILGSGQNFLSWLSSYQTFLSAVVGVLLAQYYVVSRQVLHLYPDLYNSKNSIYLCSHGISWRGFAAYIIGVIPNFYGFLGTVGVHITRGAEEFYCFAFPVGMVVSFVAFVVICYFAPPPTPPTTPTIDELHYDKGHIPTVSEKII